MVGFFRYRAEADNQLAMLLTPCGHFHLDERMNVRSTSVSGCARRSSPGRVSCRYQSLVLYLLVLG